MRRKRHIWLDTCHVCDEQIYDGLSACFLGTQYLDVASIVHTERTSLPVVCHGVGCQKHSTIDCSIDRTPHIPRPFFSAPALLVFHAHIVVVLKFFPASFGQEGGLNTLFDCNRWKQTRKQLGNVSCESMTAFDKFWSCSDTCLEMVKPITTSTKAKGRSSTQLQSELLCRLATTLTTVESTAAQRGSSWQSCQTWFAHMPS